MMVLSFGWTISYGQIKVVQGKVGVGISNPFFKLDVNGIIRNTGVITRQTGSSASALFNRTDGAAMVFGGGAAQATFTFEDSFFFEFRSASRTDIENRILNAGSSLMRIRGSDGFVGIGTLTPAALLHVNGAAVKPGGGDWATACDQRLKKNIQKYSKGLKEIIQIHPVTFEYNGKADLKEGKTYVGVIAQEFQKISPQAVGTYNYKEYEEVKVDGKWEAKIVVDENYLSVDASEIRYMLVNAVKEQQKIIEAKNAQIETLAERLTALEAMVESLCKN